MQGHKVIQGHTADSGGGWSDETIEGGEGKAGRVTAGPRSGGQEGTGDTQLGEQRKGGRRLGWQGAGKLGRILFCVSTKETPSQAGSLESKSGQQWGGDGLSHVAVGVV